MSQTNIHEADVLIEVFFKTFKNLYGKIRQTYKFNSQRRLCDQVRRIGPLWNSSAFAFESANQYLARDLSRTNKRPEKMAEVSIRNKLNSVDDKSLKKNLSDETQYTAFTKVTEDCLYFCRQFGYDILMLIPWRNDDGLIYQSTSYTWLKRNVSNCIGWTKDFEFYFLEVFVASKERSFAVGRRFKSAKVVKKNQKSETITWTANFFNWVHLVNWTPLTFVDFVEICTFKPQRKWTPRECSNWRFWGYLL